jgi:hypothetical protein
MLCPTLINDVLTFRRLKLLRSSARTILLWSFDLESLCGFFAASTRNTFIRRLWRMRNPDRRCSCNVTIRMHFALLQLIDGVISSSDASA